MRALRRLASAAIPVPLRRQLRRWHCEAVFNRAWQRLSRDPEAIANSPGDVLRDLVYGWGNESWSGTSDYLRTSMLAALQTKHPILECGSGLTTVVLARVAQLVGTTVWSLEHMPTWGEKVLAALQRCGLETAHVSIGPLRNYGDFDWYAPPLDRMPARFGTVICDGPPAATRGGRYGLVPVMRSRFASGCTILLDDAERDQESETARRWAVELRADCVRLGDPSPFFSITIPSNAVDQHAHS